MARVVVAMSGGVDSSVVLWSLEEISPEVKVPEEIRLQAKAAVDRMLEVV